MRETGGSVPSDQEPAFDAVLSVGPRHGHVARIAIEGLRAFSAPQRIFVLAGAEVGMVLARETGAHWIDEDTVLPGWTLAQLKEQARPHFPGQAPWYFQQFLKMGWARHADAAPWYLLWDSDSVPLRPVRFFSTEGRAYLTRGVEHPHGPYFDTYERLFGDRVVPTASFISQHAMVERDLMRGLLDQIEGRAGTDFVSAILKAVQEVASPHGFSEYETYAAFALAQAPEHFVQRELPWLREGSRILGKEPDPRLLPRLAKHYTFASFEHWQPRRWKYRVRYLLQHGVWPG